MAKRIKFLVAALLIAAGCAAILCVQGLRSHTVLGARAVNAAHWQQLLDMPITQTQEPLCWRGQPLPRTEDGVYWLSQDAEQGWSGLLTCGKHMLYVCADEWKNPAEVLQSGRQLMVAARFGEQVVWFTLQPTGLPIVEITGDTLQPVEDGSDAADDIGYGRITVLQPAQRAAEVVTSEIRYNLRGRSNYWSPKPNYHVSLLNDQGENRNVSLLGLRSDDDWYLYSLCTDTTKAREITACQLWNELADDFAWDYHCVQMKYAEVLLNGGYAGIYTVAEPVDQKSADLDASALIYKWRNSAMPDEEELEALAEYQEEYWGEGDAVKLVYASTQALTPWQPFMNYSRALLYEKAEDWDEALSLIDLDNQLDAALFQQFICLTDNFLANRLYVQPGESETLYRIPWDLDVSFGNYVSALDWADMDERGLPDHELDTLWRLNSEYMTEKIAERWQFLRSKYFTPEHVLELMEANRAILKSSGALQREYDRWGETGGRVSLNYTTRDMEDTAEFMRRRIEKLDKIYENYEPQEELGLYYMFGW